MSRKKSYITVTDQFCGAGGSSQGVRRLSRRMGGGIETIIAMNHWRLAIDTHSANFPKTEHDCADVSNTHPRRYQSTDILVTSPSCQKHSLGSGEKRQQKQLNMYEPLILDEEAERSRATMWDVPRFAEYHKYNIIICENVVEVRNWITFDVWLMAMDKLGYNHKICYFNSMFFHPTPQSRDRIYIVFWRKGNTAPQLDYHPVAHCPCCGKDINAVQSWKKSTTPFGKYNKQYVYRCPFDATIVTPYYYAAYNAIDWTDIGEPIYNRKRGPLSPNTIRRVTVGLDRHGAMPFMVKLEHTQQNNTRALDQALFTQTCTDSMGFVTPILTKDGVPYNNNATWPFIVENKGQSTARSSTEALSTLTTVTSHGIVTSEAFNSFITYYNGGSDVAHPVTSACGTFTTNDRLALVNYTAPTLEDCYYRSFKPREVKLGMGFDPDYIIKGNGKEQVHQCGNAVTPATMEWLIEQCVKSLS